MYIYECTTMYIYECTTMYVYMTTEVINVCLFSFSKRS